MNKKLNSSRYFETGSIDFSANNSWSYAVKKSGTGKKILEIGTSTGGITRFLKEMGNEVVGIEIDEEAAKIAGEYCSRMIIGDVEKIDFSTIFHEEKFDVILLTDVLEHLIWPEELLKKIRPLLSENGYLIISLPNFCHYDVFLNLFNGDFHYTSVGLLDLTHLRFFGIKNICNLFYKTGYDIQDLNRILMEYTELSFEKERVPENLHFILSSIPESHVYQYTFLAYPSDNPHQYPVPNFSFNQISLEGNILGKAYKITELEGELLHCVQGYEAKISDYESRVQGYEAKISDYESRVQGYETKIGEYEIKISNLQTKYYQSVFSLFHLRNVPLFGVLNYYMMKLFNVIQIKLDIQKIKACKSFSADWYLEKNPDVEASGIDPVEHFCKFGWKEGRDPSPHFSSSEHMGIYPELRCSCISKILHHDRKNKNEKNY